MFIEFCCRLFLCIEKSFGFFFKVYNLFLATYPPIVTDAAGNFLSPVTGLSFNAYKTVLEIDTMGTFNTSKIVYEKYLRVCCAHFTETKNL